MATTAAFTAAGTTIGISATLPAGETGTAYGAVSVTNIAEVVDIGAIGSEFTVITHNPISNRETFKFKGSKNGGAITLKLGKAITDAGQALLLTALDSDNDYTFNITTPDARNIIFRGKVVSFVTNIGGVNNIVGADCKIEVSGTIFETV